MNNMCKTSTQTQGVCVQQGTYEKFSLIFPVLFLLFLIGVPGDQNLHAQDEPIHWTDQDSFKVGYQLNTSPGMLPPGTQVTLKLHLEVLDPRACIGASFELVHSPIVAPESTPLSIPSLSWLGDAGELQTGESSNDDSTVTYTLNRTDLHFQSGSGWVLTAHFIVEDDSVHTADILQSIGGNLIVDENLDMRLSLPQLQSPSIKVFPNPFAEWIKVTAATPETLTATLFDLQGQLIKQTNPDSNGRIDLSEMEGGLYFLELRGRSGEFISQTRVLKR